MLGSSCNIKHKLIIIKSIPVQSKYLSKDTIIWEIMKLIKGSQSLSLEEILDQ